MNNSDVIMIEKNIHIKYLRNNEFESTHGMFCRDSLLPMILSNGSLFYDLTIDEFTFTFIYVCRQT